MHRSGTSALVGSLQQHGLFLGAHNTENKYNLRGNRENRPVLRLNEHILRAQRRHLGCAAPRGASGRTRTSTARGRSSAEYAGRPLWGFKDPRTLLTMEGWQRLVPDLEFVGIFRHPARVARSLASRPEPPVAGRSQLWQAYNEQPPGDCIDRRPFPLLVVRRRRGWGRNSGPRRRDAGAGTPSPHGEPFFTRNSAAWSAEGTLPPDVRPSTKSCARAGTISVPRHSLANVPRRTTSQAQRLLALTTSP